MPTPCTGNVRFLHLQGGTVAIMLGSWMAIMMDDKKQQEEQLQRKQ